VTGYDGVAGIYDLLAEAYSLGAIRVCKESHLRTLRAGDRVLFAGGGSGREALLAAKGGARVTVLDLSPAMLGRARRRFQAAGVPVELVLGDVLEHGPPGLYDAVVAHFFLNVFPEPAMREALGHLARLARPGGRVLIADFAPARGRLLPRVYFGLAVRAFRLLAGNPVHRLYDYGALLPEAGLHLEARRTFGPFVALSALRC